MILILSSFVSKILYQAIILDLHNNNLIVSNVFSAHPNCRLFITHGGIHSQIESIHHGVPMLSIPVFGDQTHNSIEAESRGFALYISYFDLTAEAFGSKLRSLLNEPK